MDYNTRKIKSNFESQLSLSVTVVISVSLNLTGKYITLTLNLCRWFYPELLRESLNRWRHNRTQSLSKVQSRLSLNRLLSKPGQEPPAFTGSSNLTDTADDQSIPGDHWQMHKDISFKHHQKDLKLWVHIQSSNNILLQTALCVTKSLFTHPKNRSTYTQKLIGNRLQPSRFWSL